MGGMVLYAWTGVLKVFWSRNIQASLLSPTTTTTTTATATATATATSSSGTSAGITASTAVDWATIHFPGGKREPVTRTDKHHGD
ncbi:hypothetical protein ASPZODRAFT_19814 [Penicilliopsis zonata CBS 506.65]|uniref:Uncharacterized protein n=1 Tax=Penicilliopsis zonata CBS 506.65 TaxID=1073090 RepID=A0A1L9S7J1_9EURO|nr:hypothetical protein ASPZODRAFT_19814 [Penicilliopsis zonata CBS 506.65]OJJ43122.1 hypothetical protein ASPZODRAFT_19814 [Penicilliopsis zonata CBS 506.65]